MFYHQALLQYDGTGRTGFQAQAGHLTIQGELDHSLQQLLPGGFSTRAASRTDKGVHAFAQVIKISAADPTPLSPELLNRVLPPHMRCLAVLPCPAEFIPSMDQRTKEYRYLFSSEAGEQRFIARPRRPVDPAPMRACVAMLRGTHDFKNFWSIGGVSNTTLRTIDAAELTLVDPTELFRDTLFDAGELRACWQFRIVGTGFLKHMVRHLMGALWEVGAGVLSVEDFARYLHGEQKQQRPWRRADPHGLYLVKVSYEGPGLGYPLVR